MRKIRRQCAISILSLAMVAMYFVDCKGKSDGKQAAGLFTFLIIAADSSTNTGTGTGTDSGTPTGTGTDTGTDTGTADTTPPEVSLISPANGANNVPETANISITFSEPMDKNTITAQAISGICLDSIQFSSDAFSSCLSGSLNKDSSTNFIFTPTLPLAANQHYSVKVTPMVQDQAQNALAGEFISNFTSAPDTTPPLVISVTPSGNSVPWTTTALSVTFNEMMTLSSFSATSVALDNGGIVSSFDGLSNGDMTANFTISLPAGTNTHTTTVMNSVTDSSGNNLSFNDATHTFATVAPPAGLIINETAPAESADWIELYVTSEGTLNGYEIFEGSSTQIKILPDAFVNAGDYVVIHLKAAGDETDETVNKVESANPGAINFAWDYWSTDSGLTGTDNTIYIKNREAIVVDALCFSNRDGTATSTFINSTELIYNAGGNWNFSQPPQSGVNDTLIQNECSDWSGGSIGVSLNRQSNRDTNSSEEWFTAPATPGSENTGNMAPYVISARAALANSVEIIFSDDIKASSIQSDGSQFTIFGATSLPVSAAVLTNPKTVVLTTDAQTASQIYTVIAAADIQDGPGLAMDETKNSALFPGFGTPNATIVINEVATDVPGSEDWIELYAVSDGSVGNLSLYENSSLLKAFPLTIVEAGDYFVVHINQNYNCPASLCTDDINSKTQSEDIGSLPFAWDYWSTNTGLTGTDGTILLKDNTGTVVDAFIYGNNNGSWSAALTPPLSAIASGQWTDGGDGFLETDAYNVDIDATNSFQQLMNGSTDNNDNTKWTNSSNITMGFSN